MFSAIPRFTAKRLTVNHHGDVLGGAAGTRERVAFLF